MADPIKLSGKERVILEMLLSTAGRELYGLEMVTTSGGRLARGTVYVTLDRMEEKGLVTSRREDAGPHARGVPRRLFRVTGYGARVHAAWQRWLEVAGQPGTAGPGLAWG